MLHARVIRSEEKQILLDLDPKHIRNKDIVRLFAYNYNATTKKESPPLFNVYDKLTVTPQDLKCVHREQETTVGLFVFNKYIIEGVGLSDHISYINESMNTGDLMKIGDKVAHLYLEDKIDNDTVARFITVRDAFLSMVYQIILPSLSEEIMKVHPDIEKKKDELLKKYATEIADGDLLTMNKIQKELVDYARAKLENDDSMILYMSGGKPHFDNNYRVLAIMRGPIKNEQTGKYEFVTSNLMGGIRKEDIPVSANSILASEYPTAIATASSGYQSKRVLALMQTETIGEKGSDCHSKFTMKKVATPALAAEYRYFVENGKLKLLTPDNIADYKGKILNFRSPAGCTRQNGPCNICAGDYSYHLGIRNLGLLASKISGTLLNAKTKTKHQIGYKIMELDIVD
jgi:hypothetical protein